MTFRVAERRQVDECPECGRFACPMPGARGEHRQANEAEPVDRERVAAAIAGIQDAHSECRATSSGWVVHHISTPLAQFTEELAKLQGAARLRVDHR